MSMSSHEVLTVSDSEDDEVEILSGNATSIVLTTVEKRRVLEQLNLGLPNHAVKVIRVLGQSDVLKKWLVDGERLPRCEVYVVTDSNGGVKKRVKVFSIQSSNPSLPLPNSSQCSIQCPVCLKSLTNVRMEGETRLSAFCFYFTGSRPRLPSPVHHLRPYLLLQLPA